MTVAAGRPLKVAYVMSRFPKLTETFILSELIGVAEADVDVSIYPLLRERSALVQPAAAALVERATYLPFVSLSIIASQLYHLRTAPGRYLGALAALLLGTWRSPRFLFGGVAIFPKVAHMARLMRAEGVAHVHCHFANHPAAAGFLIHRLVGLPYSFTAHGSDLHKDRTMLCEKVDDASFAVAISEYNSELMRRTCGGRTDTPIVVIHCGVDIDRFSPVETDPTPPLRIVCVGTLHEVKGQAHLIDACIELARRGVEAQCRIVGDGEDRKMLERRASDGGIVDRVEFSGLKTSDEVLALLRRSHVLVAPSVPTRSGRREGIPVVLMEAMSTGLPVVASRLSGIPELVEDGVSGLLVRPGDAVALADALERLAADPALRRMLGGAARKTVLAGFDAAANAQLLADRFRAAVIT